MPDTRIAFIIPEAKVPEAVEAFLAIYPNITKDPLQWSEAPLSDAEWFRYRIQQWVDEIINQGRRHLYRVNNPEPSEGKFARD